MLLRKNLVFLVGGAAAMLLSTAAGAQTTFERVKREGAIKIGYSNESPWAFKRPDGTLAGVDYEVATVLFKKLGINKTEDVVTNFGSLIPGLKAGRFDAVLAGLYVRPARCKEIGFSEPTIQVLDGLLVLKGNPLKLHSHADIVKNPAVKVATVQGTASGKTALRAGVPQDRMLEFTEFSALVSALRTGRIQGIVMSAVSVNEMAAADGGKTVERAMPFAPPIFDGKPSINYSAIGFRLEDTDLIAAYNKVAKDFKRSPEHLAILKAHGLTENEIAADGVTTADLCKE